MGDYVAGFLGSSEGCNWDMNAFDVSCCHCRRLRPCGTHQGYCQVIDKEELQVPRGQGNHVSVEFNILYRVRLVLCPSG